MSAETRIALCEYVIRYDGSTPSYFSGWVSGARLLLRQARGPSRTTDLPAFGATLETAQRYATADEAQQQISAMPIMASICCDVVPVPRRAS